METTKHSDEAAPGEGETDGAGGHGGATAKTRRNPLNSEGMERPRFLLDFPDDPELERLIRAFEAGNFALIRREAESLARSTSNPEVRDAALELRRRIDPDPLTKYLLAVSLALLVILTIWAYRAGPR
jgi:hypothetical protein